MAAPVVLTPSRDVVVELLQKAGCNVGDRDEAFSFERIGEGRGFCSLLYGVTLGTRKWAVKITNPSGNITGAEGSTGLHESVHDRECALYEWIRKYERDGGEKRDTERLAKSFGGTTCIGTGKEGYLIMEDFSGRMTSDVDYTKGYSVEIVRDIIRAIVGYQSAYLSAKNKFAASDKSLVHTALAGMAAHCVGAMPDKEWLPKDGERRRALIDIAKDTKSLQDTYPAGAQSLPLTLTHCDLWPNNLLFQKSEEHPDDALLAIVDWQCASVGNALLDVASAIGVCLRPEVRREKEQELIEFYIEEINKRKDRFEEKIELSKEKVLSAYRHSLRWAALQLIFTAVFNPTADAAEEGQQDGPLSRRLKAILEDIKLE